MCCLCEVNKTHVGYAFCLFLHRNHPCFYDLCGDSEDNTVSFMVWVWCPGFQHLLNMWKISVTLSFLVLCHRRNLISLVFPFLALSSSFFFSLIIHLFTQNTRLVSKVSSPAWPLLSLSTAVLTPSRVGSSILSEGTLKRKKDLSSFPSVPSIEVQVCICRVFECGGLLFAFNHFSLFPSCYLPLLPLLS